MCSIRGFRQSGRRLAKRDRPQVEQRDGLQSKHQQKGSAANPVRCASPPQSDSPPHYFSADSFCWCFGDKATTSFALQAIASADVLAHAQTSSCFAGRPAACRDTCSTSHLVGDLRLRHFLKRSRPWILLLQTSSQLRPFSGLAWLRAWTRTKTRTGDIQDDDRILITIWITDLDGNLHSCNREAITLSGALQTLQQGQEEVTIIRLQILHHAAHPTEGLIVAQIVFRPVLGRLARIPVPP